MIDRIKYIVNILIVVLMFATIAIIRDGRVVGVEVFDFLKNDDKMDEPIETTLADGTRVINSLTLGKEVIGFGGRTPVSVYIKDDVIKRVELWQNNETPSFMDQVLKSGLLAKWNGVTLVDAAMLSVDGVSGATYTSEAIITNVKRVAQYGASVEKESSNFLSSIGIKDILGLLVIFLGVFLTFLKSRNKLLRTLQLVLNVVVLGFWCGSFLSLTTITTWVANGINISLSLVTFSLLCVVIIVPLFGKKGSYCHIHCPMGSAQELIGRVPLTKIKINSKVAKVLNNLRYYILAALLFMMWLGIGFELMDYEIFSAFIISSASTVVLIMAALFLILSLFITKPYCRFVCPTGALITMAQKTKDMHQ
ncbi:MAG: FMN-binding protein [Rikenellaceae bacterium]